MRRGAPQPLGSGAACTRACARGARHGGRSCVDSPVGGPDLGEKIAERVVLVGLDELTARRQVEAAEVDAEHVVAAWYGRLVFQGSAATRVDLGE